MPGPKPPEVALSPDERQELVRLTRAHKTPQHVSFRAQVILQLADGHNTRQVADALSTSRLTVRRWPSRSNRPNPTASFPQKCLGCPSVFSL